MSFRATVESMSKIMDDMGITELDLERQFLFGVYRKHIHLSKQQAATVAVSTATTSETNTQTSEKTSDKNISGHSLKSPMVGVVYLAPEPGADTFVSVGTSVKVGDTVALVEAMKTFNPIKSDKDGVIKKILVSDGAAVEYDQPLIIIE